MGRLEALEDLRFALRAMRKTPGFTVVVILSLALGIGANTAIFTLVNALLLQTLPVRHPEQLVELLHRFPGEPALNGFSGEAYELFRTQNHVFSGLVAATRESFPVGDGALPPRKVAGGYVDGSFFSVLGLRPAAGRLIGAGDDNLNSPSSVAVISWSFWQRDLHGDPSVLGKQIYVENVPVTVLGVTPRGFVGMNEQFAEDIWMPLSMQKLTHPNVLGWGSLAVVGRLKAGVSLEQARAEMTTLFHDAVQNSNPNPFLRNMKLEMQPAGTGLSSPLRQQFRTPLLVLMGVVLLLLLVTCSNLASLLLARGAASQHEIAVRAALGANRSRLIRFVLAEPLLLAATGGLFAVVLAYFGANVLVRIMLSGNLGPEAPVNLEVRPDGRVLLFTAAASLLTVLLSGLSPALRAFAADPAEALRQASRAGETKLRRYFGKSLFVMQVAVSVLLLVAATLFIGYLSKLENINLGFRRDHLLIVALDPSRSGYTPSQLSSSSQALLQRLESLPGIRSATLSAMTPISGAGRACYCINVEDHPESIGQRNNMVFFNSVAPNYFETYGTPLLAGRTFRSQDQYGPRIAVVNQTLARFYFGDGNAIGKHFTLDGDETVYEIVGVVADAKYNNIREAPPRTIYLDTFQESRPSTQLTIRTDADPASVALTVREIVTEYLKSVPVVSSTTMASQVDATLVPERLIVTLSGWFAAIGALLVAIGLHGLLSYSVSERIREIGVRMALGATRANVYRFILFEALGLVTAGLAIGAPVAYWAKSFATHFIRDLPSNSMLPIFAGCAFMIVIGAISAYLPARRATRVDPMVALRHE